ncbi:zinc-binding dehydrogenase [Salinibacterium sp. dk2585]|uniref:alcohol dehydrogenase catalytic domain-containing protein n=1 Tax=unclassified Salinibacterium TaxID=2632331 RepID=UPI0011C24E93|nr:MULTISPECIES: alcohol dehydrogenase catalytic domain-containing protein [unclassified Salinibacterium]QEE61970.1 zinc-binding dehydrogenase [Salinibacterium sp. dk2585]TXK54475.1 alcohol dehydrogenase catalytic domain-containing protein [Salinibacterium sp. dk5596]
MLTTRAAVITDSGAQWELIDLQLDPPGPGELLVEFVASGLCQSDESMRKGTLGGQVRYPIVGGHEGAGIVREVGVGVQDIAVGDHIVCSFRPSCGRCDFCAVGKSYVCALSRRTMLGALPSGEFRFHRDGVRYGASAMLGTFSKYAVISQSSCLVVQKDIPLHTLAVLGCAVPTGWGAAVNTAQVRPGDVVVVVGAGGVGMNACQGAQIAGASEVIVIDPVQAKLEAAAAFGATAGYASLAEASDVLLSTRRGGADAIILTAAVPSIPAEAIALLVPGGNLTIAALGDPATFRLDVPIAPMALRNLSIRGSAIGSSNFRDTIPRLIELYRDGKLKLDELVTKHYTLDEIEPGFDDLAAGRNLRGVMLHS